MAEVYTKSEESKKQFDEGKILALWKAGWPTKMIALEFHVEENEIVPVMRKMGIAV